MYNASLKYKWDNKNVMDYAKAEAEAKGVAKGARKKAVEMALKLKAKNTRVDEISELTELSIEEIKAL